MSPSFQAIYGRTSFDEARDTLTADLQIVNQGQYRGDLPLVVTISNISDPAVHLRDPDGFTDENVPYYDFSALVAGDALAPEEISSLRALQFYNPNRIQFTYELSVLARINETPSFTSMPTVEVSVGSN